LSGLFAFLKNNKKWWFFWLKTSSYIGHYASY
jgi:hypothetical protein